MKKHDANFKKGKLINLQIGIIAIISFGYIIHEVHLYVPSDQKRVAHIEIEDLYDTPLGPIIVETEPEFVIVTPKVIKKPVAKPIQVKVEPATKTAVVENTTKIEITETKTTPTEVKVRSKVATKEIGSTKKAPNTNKAVGVIHNSKSVDMLPVFPGCDKYSSNDERAVCFQEKIQRMIYKKFDRSIGDELGISGKQRISLYFEINKNGEVSNIKARSQYPEFITEAKRVARLLPEMEPARRKGQKVKMAYNIPIVFKTRN